MSLSDADKQLAALVASFKEDPLGYVMFNFPWDDEPSIQLVELQEPYASRFGCKYGPDRWACEFLDELGEEIKKRGFDGHTHVDPIRFATVSGHGIGKSTIVAWLVKFILDCYPLSKGTITANTAEQLRTKTWAEVGKWHAYSLTRHWFNYSSGRGSMALVSADKDLSGRWRADAQTCREENSESFAGQHAATASSFYIFDEASAVPDKIFEVREGGLTDGMPMVFDFGNGTRNSGRFFEHCRGRLSNRYLTRAIDSRDVAITNKDIFTEWVDDYGEDSDFVKVRVRGMFPSQGSLQFIPGESVETAQKRTMYTDNTAPMVLGVDVARFGDDSSVIYARKGDDARSFPPKVFKGLDAVQLAGQIIETVNEFKAIAMPVSAIFIDSTGLGSGVVDILRHANLNPIGVNFSQRPIDVQTYRYKGDEIWGRMRNAIMDTLRLPGFLDKHGPELYYELTQREFGYNQMAKIQLESKKDMKGRGVDSPDIADALALTFSMDVAPVDLPDSFYIPSTTQYDYDPLEVSW